MALILVFLALAPGKKIGLSGICLALALLGDDEVVCIWG